MAIYAIFKTNSWPVWKMLLKQAGLYYDYHSNKPKIQKPETSQDPKNENFSYPVPKKLRKQRRQTYRPASWLRIERSESERSK